MKRLSPLVFLIFIFLLISCSAVNSVQVFDDEQARILALKLLPKATQQMIRINLPRRFTLIDTKGTETHIARMLIPQGQSLMNWQESFQTTKAIYTRGSANTPLDYFDKQIKKLSKQCDEVREQIVAQTKTYILYRLDLAHCKNIADQHQFGKIFKGQDAIYVVMYSAKRPKLANPWLQQGINSITSASLVENPGFAGVGH